MPHFASPYLSVTYADTLLLLKSISWQQSSVYGASVFPLPVSLS